jgi:hypothetical protein
VSRTQLVALLRDLPGRHPYAEKVPLGVLAVLAAFDAVLDALASRRRG